MRPTQITLFGQPAVKSLAEDQKPVYRVNTLGPGSCGLVEIIAALIGGETQIEIANAIVQQWPTAIELKRASVANLTSIHGVGAATAARIRAAFELGRLSCTVPISDRPTINSPDDTAELVKYEMSTLSSEEMWVLVLDTRNRVISIDKPYKGSVNMIQVRAGELFRTAIQCMAKSIILIHNHPSGDPTPSPDDIAITRAIVQAGKLLDIDVLDHLVIGGLRHVSLKERGVSF